MLSIDQLQHLSINPSVAREAYSHAEKRLIDVLDTKKSFEQKAFTLFAAYVALALALGGVAGTLYKEGGPANQVGPFLVSGLCLVIGAVCFVVALLDDGYGAMASDPDMWLNAGTIDGDDSVVPLMLAYVTHHHKSRIAKSISANEKKTKWIRRGIFVGLLAPVLLGILLLWLR